MHIAFANSLAPDQAKHNIEPNLSPNCFALMVSLKESFEKVDFERKIAEDIKHSDFVCLI